jgi:hypothetical protein
MAERRYEEAAVLLLGVPASPRTRRVGEDVILALAMAGRTEAAARIARDLLAGDPGYLPPELESWLGKTFGIEL